MKFSLSPPEDLISTPLSERTPQNRKYIQPPAKPRVDSRGILVYTITMSARNDKELTDNLKRFGFGEAGIEAMVTMRESIEAEAKRKRRVKPVDQPTLFDF